MCPQTIRLWLVALTALICQPLPALAQQVSPLKVLFIGNSHLFVNNVPARVRQRLTTAKRTVYTFTIAKGGARLKHYAGTRKISDVLRETNWNVIVLQEASAAFVSRQGQQRFHEAVAWFVQNASPTARIVLYQTWPWRAGSRFLRRRKANADKMWRDMQIEYATVIRQHPQVTLAPVGKCWMRSRNRSTLYSNDGNHAAVAGSQLAASIIADTIQRRALGRCTAS